LRANEAELFVGGKRLVPAAEGEIGSQDGRAFLIAAGDDLKEQIRLFPAKRQIADLRGGNRVIRTSFISVPVLSTGKTHRRCLYIRIPALSAREFDGMLSEVKGLAVIISHRLRMPRT
jgi:hypothetical protein